MWDFSKAEELQHKAKCKKPYLIMLVKAIYLISVGERHFITELICQCIKNQILAHIYFRVLFPNHQYHQNSVSTNYKRYTVNMRNVI